VSRDDERVDLLGASDNPTPEKMRSVAANSLRLRLVFMFVFLPKALDSSLHLRRRECGEPVVEVGTFH